MAVSYGVTRVACNTSTGNQDITISGVGTPKLAIFEITKATADGTAVNDAVFGMGATDGTRQFSWCTFSQNAQAVSIDKNRGVTDQCVLINDAAGNVDGEAAFVSWITDGVRINWGDAPAGAYFLTVTLIGGSDFEAYTNAVNLGTSTSAQTFGSVGFEANAVIVCRNLLNFSDLNNSFHSAVVGFVHNNGAGTVTQRSMSQTELNTSSDGVPEQRMMEDKFGFRLVSGNIDNEWTMSNFTSSGFDFQSNANTFNSDFGLIAMKFTGLSVSVGTYEPPTSATTSTLNPGFEPGLVFLGLNGCTAVDTNEQDSDAGPFGLSVMTSSAQYCNSIAIEDAAATTNTQSLSDNQAINFPNHTGGSFYAATQTGMDGSGQHFNFSAAHATTRKWIYLAVETAAGGGGGSTASNLLLLNVG